MVRELHVYGKMHAVGDRRKVDAQHMGFGKQSDFQFGDPSIQLIFLVDLSIISWSANCQFSYCEEYISINFESYLINAPSGGGRGLKRVQENCCVSIDFKTLVSRMNIFLSGCST